MMGKMQRDKGARVEREIVNILKNAGIDAKRVPLSGSSWMKGDILIQDIYRCESKARKSGFKQIYSWLSDNDFLFLKANNKKHLVVMDIETFIKIISAKTFAEGEDGHK
ncbi:MAG: hypothetical protein N2053_05160 [Chitinispirillaceae bacterium]|nr:hypothetical protein [Chitinispirillaceae bacterium]